MVFAEKLDTLMSITKTSNSTLAMYIPLDPSLISRLRRGKRQPSKKEYYFSKMATYFSHRITTEYQKAALCQTLNIRTEDYPTEREKVAELLYYWLLGAPSENNKTSEFKYIKEVLAPDSLQTFEPVPESGQLVRYGIKGKQELVLTFLSLVIKNKKPQTLLLSSDEDSSWMYEDTEFSAKWEGLMRQLIQQGNRIKVIHTLTRGTNDMFVAIKQWLPLYLSGTIEPHFYTKIRDGVFKRTLFIAPDTAAIASSSVGNNMGNNANFLVTDSSVVYALTEEFNSYMEMCRPLMHILKQKDFAGLYSTFSEFESVSSDSILKSDSLSTATMPDQVLESLILRAGPEQKRFLSDFRNNKTGELEKHPDKFSRTELIQTPNLERIKQGAEKINLFSMFLGDEIFYTPLEYVQHLNNIIRLLKSYKNYNIIFQDDPNPECLLYSKDGVGVVVARTIPPYVLFGINESHLTAAFWGYMSSIIVEHNSTDKSKTIHMLESIVTEITKATTYSQ